MTNPEVFAGRPNEIERLADIAQAAYLARGAEQATSVVFEETEAETTGSPESLQLLPDWAVEAFGPTERTYAFLGAQATRGGINALRHWRRSGFIAAGFGGVALGVFGLLTNGIGAEIRAEAHAKRATVREINLDLHRTQVLGYKADIEASTAKMEARLKVDKGFVHFNVGTGISKEWTFTGTVDASLCQDDRKQTFSYDPNTHQSTIHIPLEAISVCANTDLTNRHFSHKPGMVSLPAELATEVLRGLHAKDVPVIGKPVNAGDTVDSTLQNYAEIQAQEQAAHQCGPKVWALKQVRDAYRDDIAKQVLPILSAVDPTVTEQNYKQYIHVYIGKESAENPDDPTQMLSFKTDLDGYVQRIKKTKNMNLIPPVTAKSGCTVPSDVQMKEYSNAA